MFESFARRRLTATRTDDRHVEAAKSPMRAMTGKYVLLSAQIVAFDRAS